MNSSNTSRKCSSIINGLQQTYFLSHDDWRAINSFWKKESRCMCKWSGHFNTIAIVFFYTWLSIGSEIQDIRLLQSSSQSAFGCRCLWSPKQTIASIQCWPRSENFQFTFPFYGCELFPWYVNRLSPSSEDLLTPGHLTVCHHYIMMQWI